MPRALFVAARVITAAFLWCAGAGLPGQIPPCIPNPGTIGPIPQATVGAFCMPSGEVAAKTSPAITVFPTSLNDIPGNTNVYVTGIPLYVEGSDRDYLITFCKQDASGPAYRLDERWDGMRFVWKVGPTTLPSKGWLEDAFRTDIENIESPAVVYRLPPQVPAGSYTIDVICECRDKALLRAAIDIPLTAPIVLTWRFTIDVQGSCDARLTNVEHPQDVVSTNAPLTLGSGPCCLAGSQFWLGQPLQQEFIGIPETVRTGKYVVLAAKHRDLDWWVRDCEDVSGQGCQFGTATTRNFEQIEDHTIYYWTCFNQSGQPVGLVRPSGTEWANIVQLPAPGDYTVCVQIMDGGLGGDTQDFYSRVVSSVDIPLVVEALGPMMGPTPQVVEDGCGGIRLYVNDDDDDMNGVADGLDGAPTIGENDLCQVSVYSLLPASGATQVRLRYDGQDVLRAYQSSNRTSPISLTSSGWRQLSGSVDTFYLEGAHCNGTYAGTRLIVEVACGTQNYKHIIPVTCFGITSLTFEDGESQGLAKVARWDSLHNDIRATGFRDDTPSNKKQDYWCDPGVVPSLDDPLALTSGSDLWNNSNRNRVRVVLRVQPSSPVPVNVWLRSFDVDDISYALHGGQGELRRNFLDPFDRESTDQARKDNNGKLLVEGDSAWPHGAFSDSGVLKRFVVRQWQSTDIEELLRVSYAPADNYRVCASLSGDIITDISRLVCRNPADYGATSSYAAPAERGASIVYRRALGEVPQTDSALQLVEANSAAGTVGMMSKTLTVRRRLWIETLKSDVPQAPWDLTCNRPAENQSYLLTRFVTDVREWPTGSATREYRVQYNDNRFVPGTNSNPPLPRWLEEPVYNTFIAGLPPLMAPLGISFIEIDLSVDAGFWQSQPTIAGPNPPGPMKTFRELGVVAPSNALYPEGYGPYSNGHVYMGPNKVAAVMASSNESLWVNPLMGGLPIQYRPQNQSWIDMLARELILDTATGNVTVRPTGSAGLPLVPGTTDVRVKPDNAPSGWTQVVTVDSSSATEFVVRPDAAGVSFRLPIQVSDDTFDRVGLANLGSHQDHLDVEVSLNGRPAVNYVKHLYADTCIEPTFLSSATKPWRRNAVYAEGYGSFLSLIVTNLRHSVLLSGKRFGNERCWVACVDFTPDGFLLNNHDPLGYKTVAGGAKVEVGNGAQAYWDLLKLDLPEVYPGSGIPVISVFPIVETDEMGYYFGPGNQWDAAYTNHGFSNCTCFDVRRARLIAHELGHILIPGGEQAQTSFPGTSGTPNPDLYYLYHNVVLNGLGSEDSPPFTGHHSIPGLMAYELKVDPVLDPSMPVYNGGSTLSEPPGHLQCQLSPYMIRLIKSKLIAPLSLQVRQ